MINLNNIYTLNLIDWYTTRDQIYSEWINYVIDVSFS